MTALANDVNFIVTSKAIWMSFNKTTAFQFNIFIVDGWGIASVISFVSGVFFLASLLNDTNLAFDELMKAISSHFYSYAISKPLNTMLAILKYICLYFNLHLLTLQPAEQWMLVKYKMYPMHSWNHFNEMWSEISFVCNFANVFVTYTSKQFHISIAGSKQTEFGALWQWLSTHNLEL